MTGRYGGSNQKMTELQMTSFVYIMCVYIYTCYVYIGVL